MAWVCGCSIAGIVGSNPAGAMDFLFLVSVVCCQVKASAPADHSSRGVLPILVCLNACDRVALIMRRLWPTGGCCAMVKKYHVLIFHLRKKSSKWKWVTEGSWCLSYSLGSSNFCANTNSVFHLRPVQGCRIVCSCMWLLRPRDPEEVGPVSDFMWNIYLCRFLDHSICISNLRLHAGTNSKFIFALGLEKS